MGSLITQLKTTFSCGYEVIVVPGNHDVSHGTNILDIENLKSENYSEIEMVEYKKLKTFIHFLNSINALLIPKYTHVKELLRLMVLKFNSI